MSRERGSMGERVMAGLKFWLVVAVLCGVCGATAYQVGKHYVAAHLHETEFKQPAPEIVPQVTTRVATDEETEQPPVKPVVIMTEREPTAREERRARREITEPQDGAQLHQAEAEAARDANAEEEEEAATAEASSEETATGPGAGEFSVVAGSFADPTNAQRQVERLAERGYQAYTTTVEKNGITYRRVHVGVYDSRDEAEKVRDRLRSQGIDAMVTEG